MPYKPEEGSMQEVHIQTNSQHNKNPLIPLNGNIQMFNRLFALVYDTGDKHLKQVDARGINIVGLQQFLHLVRSNSVFHSLEEGARV